MYDITIERHHGVTLTVASDLFLISSEIALNTI